MAGIYLHIPFCIRKCPYCDFYSGGYDEGAASEFCGAMKKNLLFFREQHGKLLVETVYFGGGTPTTLPQGELSGLLCAVKESFCLNKNAEITLEANPGTVDLEKLSKLRESGFNRISFGVQSFQDDELKALGRIHSAKETEEAVKNALAAGFSNISADLMLGVPCQTEDSLRETIRRMAELPLTHISAYMLKIEPGTPYDSKVIREQIPDDDEMADRYLLAVELLKQAGFYQYEISNFAKPGFEGRHNLNYWRSGEYLGFGPGAHSYFGGKRFAVPSSLAEFISCVPQNTVVTEDAPGDFFEYAMLKIRLSEGLDLAECTKKFGIDSTGIFRRCEPLEKAGLLKVRKSVVSLTPRGFLVSNGIIGRLFGDWQQPLQDEKITLAKSKEM